MPVVLPIDSARFLTTAQAVTILRNVRYKQSYKRRYAIINTGDRSQLLRRLLKDCMTALCPVRDNTRRSLLTCSGGRILKIGVLYGSCKKSL